MFNLKVNNEKCTGCRACEFACSYHHGKIFNTKLASLHINRAEREGKMSILLYNDLTEKEREKLSVLEKQINDIESRLEHLYDALETGTFSSEELAPRIRKLQARKEEISLAKERAELALQVNVFEMPDMAIIQEYVNDLRSLLGASPIVEQRAFLKSFVEEIQVDKEKVTVNYTLPMPPKNSEEEVIGVLPFIQHGRPCRSRTTR